MRISVLPNLDLIFEAGRIAERRTKRGLIVPSFQAIYFSRTAVIFAVTCASILMFAGSSSLAQSCFALRKQLANTSGVGDAPAVQQLNRQLSAIQRLEKQRGCGSKKATGGFFDACGDLASRRMAVQREIGKSSGSNGRAATIRAKFVALGCESGRKKQVRAKPVEPKGASMDAGGGVGDALYCVRLSDGYYFPTPKSRFSGRDDQKLALEQCRYICRTPDVELYLLSDISLETEQIVSIEGGKPYTELRAAFKYREDANFKRCDSSRYYRLVDELRARTVTPTNMTNAIIPLPTPRPDAPIDAAVEPAPGASLTEPLGFAEDSGAKRHVRAVGPRFFPQE